MADDALYDEERGLRDIARSRLRTDERTRSEAEIGDQLAGRMRRHFPAAADAGTAGRALLISSAGVAGLAAEGVHATAICNILAFTAGNLIDGARGGGDEH